MLRDCPFVKNFWCSIIPYQLQALFFTCLQVDQWLLLNLKYLQLVNDVPWRLLFPLALWRIWNRRNSIVFDDELDHHLLHRDGIVAYGKLIFAGLRDKFHVRHKPCFYVSWSPPPLVIGSS